MSRERPTILQLIPELDTGGAELSTIEIADAIQNAGGRALVASEGGRLVPQLNACGAEFIPFPASSKNPARILWNARILRNLIETERVDLIHARSRAPAWSGYLAAKQSGIPFVATYHGAYSETNALKKRYNRVMAAGDVTIANSQFTADLVRTRYALPEDKLRIIYRGIDAGIFDPALDLTARKSALLQTWGLSPETRTIAMLARFSPIKGHSVVVDAVHRLVASGKFNNAHVIFAGDAQGRADYLKQVQTQISDRRLTGMITNVGHVDDVPAALALAHCAVIATTKPETFGRTSVEAQAMACPVIATNIGAPPETVLAEPRVTRDEITGWLVPPNDPDQLATALEAALALTPAERQAIGDRARARAITRFSLRQMRGQTLAVYDELLGSTLADKL